MLDCANGYQKEVSQEVDPAEESCPQEIIRSEKVSTQEAFPEESKEKDRIKSEADTEDHPAPERSSVLGERFEIRLGRTVWRFAKFVANSGRGFGERRRIA